jgi:hypothetical protein
MVGPMPPIPSGQLSRLRRRHRYGSVEFCPGGVEVAGGTSQEARTTSRARCAERSGRKFLSWSRFPIFRVESEADGAARVEIQDARYPPFHGSWASTVIVLPPRLSQAREELR